MYHTTPSSKASSRKSSLDRLKKNRAKKKKKKIPASQQDAEGNYKYPSPRSVYPGK